MLQSWSQKPGEDLLRRSSCCKVGGEDMRNTLYRGSKWRLLKSDACVRYVSRLAPNPVFVFVCSPRERVSHRRFRALFTVGRIRPSSGWKGSSSPTPRFKWLLRHAHHFQSIYHLRESPDLHLPTERTRSIPRTVVSSLHRFSVQNVHDQRSILTGAEPDGDDRDVHPTSFPGAFEHMNDTSVKLAAQTHPFHH